MVLVMLVKAWYARAALRQPDLLPVAPPWRADKQRPSFPDMLAALRCVAFRGIIESYRKETYATRCCGDKFTSFGPPQNTPSAPPHNWLKGTQRHREKIQSKLFLFSVTLCLCG
jgi:hypothetical protein